jgi:dethiobiotin synthetase
LRGVFVTGTGTEVGKTVVAAAIARTHAEAGERVGVFKPAVSGLDEGGEPDHALLRRAAGSSQSDDEIAPYRYDPPVARLLATARAASVGADLAVCEGVGGLLVPLTLGYLVRDLARDLGLPVVVAASPDLGTINHTLLTVECARAVGLEVSAVVLTPWPDEPGTVEASNREAIERLAQVKVETLPRIDVANPGSWPALSLP